MKNKINKGIDYLLILIQAGLSIYVLHSGYKVMPMKYFSFVVVVFALLLALAAFLMLKKGSNIKNMVGKIISLILSIALCFGTTYVSKTMRTLNNITSGNYQTHVVSLIVLNDSSFNEASDLSGKIVGNEPNLSVDKIESTLTQIKDVEKVDFTSTEIEGLEALNDALINKKVNAILLNEAYRGMIEEFNPTFSEDTRTIYQYEIKEVLPTAAVASVTKETFSVYISGIDTYGPVSTVARSDVNMIMTVNPVTKQILLTSIPRDYYVTLASFGAKDKLTHSGVYGINETVSTVANLLNMDIDYYLRVNFTSLINVVDAVGGVEVYSDRALSLSGFNYVQGYNHMNGEMALRFARERYSYTEGDRHRVLNQQEVLSGLLKKIMSPTLLSNYSNILDSIGDAMEMNVGANEIQSLIQMQLQDMASWDILQYSLDGYGSTSTICYAMPGYNLYVMEPDVNTVETASHYIKEMEANNRITMN